MYICMGRVFVNGAWERVSVDGWDMGNYRPHSDCIWMRSGYFTLIWTMLAGVDVTGADWQLFKWVFEAFEEKTENGCECLL